jgi:hypothetical protein
MDGAPIDIVFSDFCFLISVPCSLISVSAAQVVPHFSDEGLECSQCREDHSGLLDEWTRWMN